MTGLLGWVAKVAGVILAVIGALAWTLVDCVEVAEEGQASRPIGDVVPGLWFGVILFFAGLGLYYLGRRLHGQS